MRDAFFVAVFVYKDLGIKDVPRVLLNSANLSAMLLYIITNAILFSFLMTHENIPQTIADWMLSQGYGAITFLLFVNLLLLVAGTLMEPSSIVLILAPILFPVAVKLGIDPVHFGIIMVVNMEIGMVTPPVGLNLYVASGITKMGLTELTVAVWPWLLTMLVFLIVITYWPPLSLFTAGAWNDVVAGQARHVQTSSTADRWLSVVQSRGSEKRAVRQEHQCQSNGPLRDARFPRGYR